MALTKQKENFVIEVVAISRELLGNQKYIQQLIGRWNQNDFFNQITDADLLSSERLSHLTNSELANAITAITAVDTALGDYSDGQAVNLLKMVE